MSNIEKSEIRISVYGTKDAPAAADFRRGATSLQDVQDAIDARNELSDAQSTTKSGPIRRD